MGVSMFGESPCMLSTVKNELRHIIYDIPNNNVMFYSLWFFQQLTVIGRRGHRGHPVVLIAVIIEPGLARRRAPRMAGDTAWVGTL